MNLKNKVINKHFSLQNILKTEIEKEVLKLCSSKTAEIYQPALLSIIMTFSLNFYSVKFTGQKGIHS